MLTLQGLHYSYPRDSLAQFVTMLYKAAFKRVQTVFFENRENADEFVKRNIISPQRETILKGAGINLCEYEYRPYPANEKPHFLYLGRIMKEKGMDELFEASEKLYNEGESFVLDLVGFLRMNTKKRFHGLRKGA